MSDRLVVIKQAGLFSYFNTSVVVWAISNQNKFSELRHSLVNTVKELADTEEHNRYYRCTCTAGDCV